jgi:hypothetical protein
MNASPTGHRPELPIVDEVRRAFNSTLANWTQDLLLARSQETLAMTWQQEPHDEADRWSLAASWSKADARGR